MFHSIILDGWNATIYSQDMLNSAHPFVETVVITNDDNMVKITILSQHSYVENKNYAEGLLYNLSTSNER